jgi:hypothetical protein
LLHEVLTHGTNWAVIAGSHTPKRTTLALKNRYSALRLKHDNQIAKASKQNSGEGSGRSRSLGQLGDYDNVDDMVPETMETDESDNEESTDYLDSIGATLDDDCGRFASSCRMINREANKDPVETALDGSDDARKANAGEIAYGTLFPQPAASASMENWMTSMFGATESAESHTWRSRDFIFPPERQGAKFLGPRDTQELAGMMTPPATAIGGLFQCFNLNYLSLETRRGK